MAMLFILAFMAQRCFSCIDFVANHCIHSSILWSPVDVQYCIASLHW